MTAKKKAAPRPAELAERKRRRAKKHQVAEGEMVVESGPGWTMKLAAAEGVLAGLEVDHVIVDPPFSERTHSGQRHGRRSKKGGRQGYKSGWCSESGLGYGHLTETDVRDLAEAFHKAAGSWILVMTDHVLFPTWEESLRELGRYVFAPVPIVIPGMNVRLAGDGPSNWTIWMVVARPRGLRDGTKPGAYLRPPEDPREDRVVKGAKPLGLMDQIIRDYSKAGDTICDPFAGSGSTGVAALRTGRKFVGVEINPDRFAHAVGRLRGCGDPLFLPHREVTQETLL